MTYQSSGIEYGKINGYTIYQFNNKNAQNYFLSVPDEYVENYQLFIGFPNKDLKDKPQKEIIEEFKEMNNLLNGINKEGIYIIPDISPKELEEAAKENDNKKFNQILNKLTPMISEAYQTLISYNTAKKNIDQVTNFIKKTESDRKFVDWLEINMPNFIHGITYEEIKKQYYNPDIYTNIFEEPQKEKSPNENYTIGYVNKVAPTIQSYGYEYDSKDISNNLNKVNVKKRILKQNNRNNYGFINIFKIILLLGIITLSGILISLFLLK